MVHLIPLGMRQVDGTQWTVVLIIQDNHVNLQNAVHPNPAVQNLLQLSRGRFLSGPELLPLFEEAAYNRLQISPATHINHEGLYFVVSDSYRDGTRYKPVNGGRNSQSNPRVGSDFTCTQAILETNDQPPVIAFIRRNLRRRGL